MRTEMCTCGNILIIADSLDRIEDDIKKLRKTVEEGRYDPRSDVGDAVLRMEGQMREIRRKVPRLDA